MKNKLDEYSYDVLRKRKILKIEMLGERDFTDEETIEALEWLVFELRLSLREYEDLK